MLLLKLPCVLDGGGCFLKNAALAFFLRQQNIHRQQCWWLPDNLSYFKRKRRTFSIAQQQNCFSPIRNIKPTVPGTMHDLKNLLPPKMSAVVTKSIQWISPFMMITYGLISLYASVISHSFCDFLFPRFSFFDPSWNVLPFIECSNKADVSDLEFRISRICGVQRGGLLLKEQS